VRPSRYDVAFLGAITQFFSPERNTTIFRKAYDALVDGGTLVINAVRRGYLDPANPGLRFYAVSTGGAYNFAEYKDILEHVGHTNTVVTNTVDLSIQPIKAIKRLAWPKPVL
jgi:hypothetical protein